MRAERERERELSTVFLEWKLLMCGCMKTIYRRKMISHVKEYNFFEISFSIFSFYIFISICTINLDIVTIFESAYRLWNEINSIFRYLCTWIGFNKTLSGCLWKKFLYSCIVIANKKIFAILERTTCNNLEMSNFT